MYLDQDFCTDEYLAYRAEGMTSDNALDKVSDLIQSALANTREDSTAEYDLIELRNWWMDLDPEEIEG